MSNLIACNLASYGGLSDEALAHLAALGLRHVEVACPPLDGVEALRARLAAHGLSASSVMAGCPVAEPDLAEQMRPACEAAAALGAKIIFVSAQARETPLTAVHERLYAAGEVAEANGVTIALETHPDLCQNATQMLETMAGVRHDHIRINFDTANIYYYNEDIDGLSELRRVNEFVAAVHLKDTNGRPRTWYFPTLGQGIVDFAGLFAELAAGGFTGPYTMELEGIEGQNLDFAGKAESVAGSVAYLRSAGLMD